MKVKVRGITGRETVLHVRSNPAAIVGWGDAAYVTDLANWDKFSYKELTHFFNDWEVLASHQHQIPIPFLHDKVGLGTVVGNVLKWFHIYAKPDCGCPDRAQWFNWLLAFVPFGYKEPVNGA